MTTTAEQWTEATLDEVPWAGIDMLCEADDLHVAVPANPLDGPDRVMIASFRWPRGDLDRLLDELGLTKRPRSGRRAIAVESWVDATSAGGLGGPIWWTPYAATEFEGTRALVGGLGRELIVQVGPNETATTITVFLRTYET